MANGHGGARKGAGRKPKDEELKAAEKIENIIGSDKIIQKLGENVDKGNVKAIQLAMEYLWGKAPQSVDHTTKGEKINNFNIKDIYANPENSKT